MGAGLGGACLRRSDIKFMKLDWKRRWKDGVVCRIISKIESTDTAGVVDGDAAVPRVVLCQLRLKALSLLSRAVGSRGRHKPSLRPVMAHGSGRWLSVTM